MCLATGDYEAFYKGERVAVHVRNRMVFVYRNGGWHEVPEAAIDVVYTLRQYENGNIKYITDRLYHTPKPKELPVELPEGWLEV